MSKYLCKRYESFISLMPEDIKVLYNRLKNDSENFDEDPDVYEIYRSSDMELASTIEAILKKNAAASPPNGARLSPQEKPAPAAAKFPNAESSITAPHAKERADADFSARSTPTSQPATAVNTAFRAVPFEIVGQSEKKKTVPMAAQATPKPIVSVGYSAQKVVAPKQVKEGEVIFVEAGALSGKERYYIQFTPTKGNKKGEKVTLTVRQANIRLANALKYGTKEDAQRWWNALEQTKKIWASNKRLLAQKK